MATARGKSTKTAAVKKPRAKKAAEPVIHSIKGTNRDLTCNGYQFEPGKTFEHKGTVKCCREGFHACTVEAHPLSVFGYYAPGTSRYFEVVQSGPFDTNDDVKIASAKITIGVELSIPELTRRAIEWVFKRSKPEGESATGDYGAARATGDYGAARATGDYGAASATGTRGAASATGYRGAASATGDCGAASATGCQGAASATGKKSAAMAAGYDGRVSGAKGCALFALERDNNWNIVSTASGIVGRDGLEPDTFYACKNGKLIAA